MTTLDAFVDQCWSDHADDPQVIASRIDNGLALVRNEDESARLSMLAHHVFGEHLGNWRGGIGFLDDLAALGIPGDAGKQTLQRCRASLRLCAGLDDERRALTNSDACRVTIMAASSLAAHDPNRSSQHLNEAVSAAAGFSDDDPAVRSLASFSNNIAGTLQDQSPLNVQQCVLMLRAAEVARTHWQRAGTWREVERAEYRLSVCFTAAGDGLRAVEHAKQCNEMVQANGSEPLEVFFAAEALALAALQTQDRTLFTEALRTAEQSFTEIDQSDRGWCLPTLEKLQAQAVAATSGNDRPGAV